MQRLDVQTPAAARTRPARTPSSRSDDAVYPVMDYIADMAGQLATMAGFADDEVLAAMLNAAAVHAQNRRKA